jgi:hypothetical protein
MADEVVHTILSPSGRFRALIVRKSSGALLVELERWIEEWVPGYGKVDEFWSRMNTGMTYTDTIERAEQLANEALRMCGD